MSEAVANVSESYGPRVPSVGEGIVSPPILKLHDRDCRSLGSNLRTRCQKFRISCNNPLWWNARHVTLRTSFPSGVQVGVLSREQ